MCVRFIIYIDHRRLIFLKNMSKESAKLIRIISELEEFDYEIEYLPGKNNSAADVLSRIMEKEMGTEEVDDSILPKGLMVMKKIDGGGDSLFKALHVVLEDAGKLTGKFKEVDTDLDLRKISVHHLLNNVQKLGMKCTKNVLREWKATRHKGALPCIEVLLAVSDLFGVEIYVHFGMKSPIVYRTNTSQLSREIIHLQCLGGVHFNPVLNRKNINIKVDPNQVNFIASTSVTHESPKSNVSTFLNVENYRISCQHSEKIGTSPMHGSVGDIEFCCLIDTGAEVSLLSEDVWLKIKEISGITSKLDTGVVTGIGDQKVKLKGIIEVEFKFLGITANQVPFGVVDSKLMPNCCLLGANFLAANSLILDYNQDLLWFQNEQEEIFHTLNSSDQTAEQGLTVMTPTSGDKLLPVDSRETMTDETEIDSSYPKLKYIFNQSIIDIQDSDHAVSCLKEKVIKGVHSKYSTAIYLQKFKRRCPNLIFSPMYLPFMNPFWSL